jgi:peptidoglycan/xylan/chitin deacetylase (PgdA/CDA1 family)
VWRALKEAQPDDRERALAELRSCFACPSAPRPTHRSLHTGELLDLARSSLIEIGAHTVTHPALAVISPDRQQFEIQHSKASLESTLNKPVTSFSYPFGARDDYTPETVDIVQRAGFRSACSNFPGCVTAGSHRFQLPRHVVLDWDSGEFVAQLSRWFRERSHQGREFAQYA